MAQSVYQVDVSALEFGELQKQNTKPRNYLPLATPLVFQTGTGYFVDDKGPDMYIKLSKKQLSVIVAIEERLMGVGLQQDIPWFSKDQEYFQSSADLKDCTLRLRKSSDLVMFDNNREPVDYHEGLTPGAYVLAVVELSYISFARSKFGGVFVVKQLLSTVAPPPCMISFVDEKTEESQDPDEEL